MLEINCTLFDLEATTSFAAKIAEMIHISDVILLSGPLGAGKSAFARALLRSICRDPMMEVPSPSFTLVQIYEAEKFSLYHYDLWRLEGSQDLIELGWEEAREGVVIVEWPDRLQNLIPSDALHIEFSVNQDESRQVRIHGWEDRPLSSLVLGNQE